MAESFTTYAANEPFPGTIGRTAESSSPAWPARQQPPEGAPNIVMIVLDDVGYGQLSAFGGLCETPNLDRLADNGLRYANFQTTALCSPTRGCLLTGRNHHSLGLGAITELSMGYPGLNGTMGFEHGFISEVLVEQGYNTFAVGKWHLTPSQETTPAGPFNRWPLARGFEGFYGFLGGDTDQFHPDLVHDNHSVRQPSTPAEGYHLNVDLADRAISYIADAHSSAPDKPFFLWFAPGTGHAPHQVESQWIEQYKGAFDDGWDAYRTKVFERQGKLGLLAPGTELSERDPDVAPWDSLTAEAQQLYARQMEVYAGFITQTDFHIGRVLEAIEALGELNNTLVIAVSDNGASAEGGEHGTRNEGMFFNLAPQRLEDNLEVMDQWGSENTFNHYSWGWTWAGDTPFRRWKRETYRGGITDPCIISWPAGIAARGEVRHQYAHAIDMVPTLLEAIGIASPEAIRGVAQSQVHGVSLLPTFADSNAEDRHRTQYFEMMGHRSIYHEGWKAVCPYPGPSLVEGAERGHPFGTAITEAILDQLEAADWELYNLQDDPSETQNLAAEQPERLAGLRALWWEEAEKYNVLPLASGDIGRLVARRPTVGGGHKVIKFNPGGSPLPFTGAPRVYNRTHAVIAQLSIPAGGAEGILLSHGNRHGGYAVFLVDGHLNYVHNYLGLKRFTVTTDASLSEGDHEVRMEFAPSGPPNFLEGLGSPAQVRLVVDGTLAGYGELPYTVPNLFSTAGVSCGYAAFDTIDPSVYEAPFAFTGIIHNLEVDLGGELVINPAAELAALMAQQ